MKIAFFGTTDAFNKFTYDTLEVRGIEFILCTSVSKIRGTYVRGYYLHFSASRHLRQELTDQMDMINTFIYHNEKAFKKEMHEQYKIEQI